MFWRVVLIIIALALFVYLGGGRLVVQAGNGIVRFGEGIQRVEMRAKGQSDRLLGYIQERGEKQAEKGVERRRKIEEEAEKAERERRR